MKRVRRVYRTPLSLAVTLSWAAHCPLVFGEPEAKGPDPAGKPQPSVLAPGEKGATPDPGDSVEVVVTGTRTPEQSQRATLRTGVITREEAQRRGATNVGEALAGEPGLQVNPNAYDFLGGPAGVQIQGFDAERVLILRDGERAIGDLGGVVDLAAYPLTDVERIEYVAGPTSSLYGTGAIGGVVNIITGPPANQGISTRGRVEARSVPATLVEESTSYRSGAYFGTVDVSHRQSAGIELLDDRPDLALPDREQLGIGLRLGHEGKQVDSLAFARWSEENAHGLSSEEVPVLGSFLVDLPSTTHRYSLRNIERLRLGDGSQLQSSLSAQWFANRASKDRRDSPLDERRLRAQDQQSAELTVTIADGGRTWVIGLRAEREAFGQRLSRVVSTQGEVEQSEQIEVSPIELRSAAAYAQLGWKLFDDLIVMPGARFEVHERFGHVAAPRLAAAWFPSERWRFRVALGTGFRAPSAKEFGFFFDHSFLGYRVMGNDDLRPERSLGVTSEVSFGVIDDVQLRVGAFYNRIVDLIATEFTGQAQVGVDDFSYVNVGGARTAGVETSVVWSLLPTLRSEIAYAYLFTHNDDLGQPLPSRPAHTLLSSLVYQPVEELSFTYRQRTVSRAFIAQGVFAPGFITLDFRAAYQVFAFSSAYVAVLNALDAQDDSSRPGDQRPLVGRTYAAGLVVDWPVEE